MTKNMRLVVVGVGAIVLIGLVVSQFASSQPDGLEFVAEREGFDETAEDHSLADAPLADYGGDGVSRSIAAAVGIAITLGAGFVLFKALGRGNESLSQVDHDEA